MGPQCCRGSCAVIGPQCCHGSSVLSWVISAVVVPQCCHGSSVLSWVLSAVMGPQCCHLREMGMWLISESPLLETLSGPCLGVVPLLHPHTPFPPPPCLNPTSFFSFFLDIPQFHLRFVLPFYLSVSSFSSSGPLTLIFSRNSLAVLDME